MSKIICYIHANSYLAYTCTLGNYIARAIKISLSVHCNYNNGI